MKGRGQSASYSLPSWGIGFDKEPQKAVMDNLRHQLRMFGTCYLTYKAATIILMELAIISNIDDCAS